MERSEALRRVRLPEGDKDRLTVTAAAKHLGVSRTRITQLAKKQAAKVARPPAPPPAVPQPQVVMPDAMPTRRDPAPDDRPATPEAPPVGPIDLKSVLDPVGAPPPVVPVDAVPMGGVDPDDAEAGRELLSWARRGSVELFARILRKIDPTDPRLEKLKEENKFLKVSLKRNSDKAAPLGWFTRGWVGLAIGFGIEFIKVTWMFPPTAPKGPPPPSPSPKPVDDVETAPPVTTVQENRDEVEGRPRLTIEERLRIFNERNQ